MRAYMTGFLSWRELLMRLNFSGYVVLWLTHIVCFLEVPVNPCTEEQVWRWQGGCESCTPHEEKGIPWAHESQAALKEGVGASGEKVVAKTPFATSSRSCCLISCIPSAAVGLKKIGLTGQAHPLSLALHACFASSSRRNGSVLTPHP